MAPADLRKEGSAYDLSIAIGILGISDLIKAENLEKYIIMGELFRRRFATDKRRSTDCHKSQRRRFQRHYFTQTKCKRSRNCQ